MSKMSRLKLLGAAWFAMATIASLAKADDQEDFENFSDMRAELLDRIGAATSKIMLATDFLTDADVVSSLYISQYRKVTVQVLLGKERAANILSRLNYMKQVNIPVSIRPKTFYPKMPTVILIDSNLFAINSELDYLSKKRSYTIKSMPTTELALFQRDFGLAIAANNAPTTRQLPQVGHARVAKSPSADGNTSRRSVLPRTSNSKPGIGIPTKLPRSTISQERERQRAASPPPSPALESP